MLSAIALEVLPLDVVRDSIGGVCCLSTAYNHNCCIVQQNERLPRTLCHSQSDRLVVIIAHPTYNPANSSPAARLAEFVKYGKVILTFAVWFAFLKLGWRVPPILRP